MALQDMLQGALPKIKKQYLTQINRDINTIFSSGDMGKIQKATLRLDEFSEYVKNTYGGAELPYRQKKKRLEEDRENLIEVLKNYEHNQKVTEEELCEKTGLKPRQLGGYARGKNPIFRKEGDSYTIIRIIKKNPQDL